jgi:hypothetical protein
MPHDHRGEELKVGDVVMVPCVVKAIHLTEDYCNVDLVTREFMHPTRDVTRLTLNSRQTVKPRATFEYRLVGQAPPEERTPLRLDVSKEWCERMAALEDGQDITAGSESTFAEEAAGARPSAPVSEMKPRFDLPDDELLPLTRCICGVAYKSWEMTLSIYEEDAVPMPCCGRRLYFRQTIEVLDAAPPRSAEGSPAPQE